MNRKLSFTGFGFVLTILGCGSNSISSPAGGGGAGSVAGGASADPGGEPATPGGKAAGGGLSDADAVSGMSGKGGAPGGPAESADGPAQSADGPAGRAGAASSNTAGAAGTTALALPSLVTSAPGAYWKTDRTFTVTDSSTADVTVNDAATAQKWEGFGAAFNEQGWAALTSSAMQQQAMTLLFSIREGAAFAWGRIPIGANDYALSRYTLDDSGADVAPDATESNRPSTDTALSLFSLARDGEKLIPYVKAAQAIKPDLRFWASPWTPPVWMKTGYRKTDGWNPVNKPSYYDGGTMRSDAAMLSAYAQYFAKFVQGYKAQGIDIRFVAPQEEPNYEQSYPSCVWDKATFSSFIGQYLGPTMKGLGVEVILGTLADDPKDFDLAAAVLADSSAKSFSTVIGAQWGVLAWPTKLAALNANLPVWATEHKGGNYPWNPSGFPTYSSVAPNDEGYAVESWNGIRDAITKAKVTLYNAWNTVLDKNGWSIDTNRTWAQNALLVADSGTVTATPAYYVFRHLSEYVVPGATVIGTTGGDALAFKNPDGSFVAVLFNSGAANEHFVVAMGGKKLQFALPANGWATLKYEPSRTD